jgi:CRP/FNR family cyclic AMP-dependent transcriptional regulator
MRSIDDLLHEHPFFDGLDCDTLALLAGCAANRHVNAGDYLYREGTPADTFYVIRHGRVAIEAHDGPRGAVVIETVGDGEVLGWSWLIPPHRWHFDGRAVESTSVVVFDGACLRTKCDEDPRLGYAILQRVAAIMYTRLQGTRVRLLDLYGVPNAQQH